MSHLKKIHDELRSYMDRYREALVSGSSLDMAELMRQRLILFVAMRETQGIIGKTIDAVPLAHMPAHTSAVLAEYRNRAQRIGRAHDAKIRQWTPKKISTDPRLYQQEATRLHRLIDAQFRWEEESLVPLLELAALLRRKGVVAAPLSAVSRSSGPSSPAPRHTIGASSSASAPSGSHCGRPVAATGHRAAGAR